MKTGITMQIPKQVLVTDVVARDGFQNEDRLVSTEDKLRVTLLSFRVILHALPLAVIVLVVTLRRWLL
jgi:hypothetical protein